MLRVLFAICIFSQILAARRNDGEIGQASTSTQSGATDTNARPQDATLKKDTSDTNTPKENAKTDTRPENEHNSPTAAADKKKKQDKEKKDTKSASNTAATSTKQKPPVTEISTAPPATPLNSPMQAATDAIVALESALSLRAADNAQVSDYIAGKPKSLRSDLAAKKDARQIAREAAMWTEQLYGPPNISDPKPVASTPPTNTPSWLSGNALLLVLITAVISPLVCVAGFFGARIAGRQQIRDLLREAGLL